MRISLLVMLVCHNGKFISQEKACIPVYNKAAFFDFGVYEAIKVLKGKAFLPEKHIARLFKSAKAIGLNVGYQPEQILNWINQLIQKNKHESAYLRILVYGQTESDQQVELFIFPLGLTFYPHKLYQAGAKVITYPGERLLPQSKSMNLLLGFLALRQAYKQDALEALMVNNQGCLIEGTRSNLFVVREKQVIMPLKNQILTGVTLEILLKLIKKVGIKVTEGQIKLKDLKNYQEIFITSTGMGVMPVSQVDNLSFEVGEITLKLHQFYKEFEHQYFN